MGTGDSSWPDALGRLPGLYVLERMPVPVLAVDEHGTILFANDAFAALLGYFRDVLLALRFDQIFSTSTLYTPALSTMRALADTVVELCHADGSAVMAHMSRSALLRDGDDVALVVFEDRTERLWIDGPRN